MPDRSSRVAVLPDVRLGDGLLALILTHNLQRAGRDVTTHHDLLRQLRAWFPRFRIETLPAGAKATWLGGYDLIVDSYSHFLDDEPALAAKRVAVGDFHFDPQATRAANLQRLAGEVLACPDPTIEPGVEPPPDLKHRKHAERVLLHPTSASERKTWPSSCFLKLAELLEARGFRPVFCLGPSERSGWQPLLGDRFEAPPFPDLDALARYTYESGYFIGNDSGPGHLASLLRVPTLSLFYKKSKAQRWRPGWGDGAVAVPGLWLPSSRLRRRYWRRLLTPARVLATFERLTRR